MATFVRMPLLLLVALCRAACVHRKLTTRSAKELRLAALCSRAKAAKCATQRATLRPMYATFSAWF